MSTHPQPAQPGPAAALLEAGRSGRKRSGRASMALVLSSCGAFWGLVAVSALKLL